MPEYTVKIETPVAFNRLALNELEDEIFFLLKDKLKVPEKEWLEATAVSVCYD